MTRSGKTAVTLQRTANEPRLIVWDFPGRDWPRVNCERLEGLPALTARLLEVRDGPCRISYRAPALNSKEFGKWAQAVLAWTHFAPCCAVAEELADVVHPGKAPGGWGELVRGGLAYGNTIYGITQRIQETDKSILGNADIVRVFQCTHDDDVAYISRKTGIAQGDISGLNKLDYIEKHKHTGELSRFTLTF